MQLSCKLLIWIDIHHAGLPRMSSSQQPAVFISTHRACVHPLSGRLLSELYIVIYVLALGLDIIRKGNS